jgi:transcriptional regulator with XRE-family HTH domain
MNENKNMPHNGQLLKRLMDERRYTQSQLAYELGTQNVTVFRLIEKESISSHYLWQLSNAMNINLFTVLAQLHPVNTPTAKEIELEKQVLDLQKEVAIYKELLRK